MDRRGSHSSEIEEEIADEVPLDDLSRKSSQGDDSIADEVGSNNFRASSSESQSKEIKEEISIKSSFQQLRNHKPFNYKMQAESISESIKEDFI